MAPGGSRSSGGSRPSRVATRAQRNERAAKCLRADQVVTSKHFRGETAVIRFVGKTHFAEGYWVGVQAPVGVGKNSGDAYGVRYFNCPRGCGLFVRPEDIEVLLPSKPDPRAVAAFVKAELTRAGMYANTLKQENNELKSIIRRVSPMYNGRSGQIGSESFDVSFGVPAAAAAGPVVRSESGGSSSRASSPFVVTETGPGEAVRFDLGRNLSLESTSSVVTTLGPTDSPRLDTAATHGHGHSHSHIHHSDSGRISSPLLAVPERTVSGRRPSHDGGRSRSSSHSGHSHSGHNHGGHGHHHSPYESSITERVLDSLRCLSEGLTTSLASHGPLPLNSGEDAPHIRHLRGSRGFVTSLSVLDVLARLRAIVVGGEGGGGGGGGSRNGSRSNSPIPPELAGEAGAFLGGAGGSGTWDPAAAPLDPRHELLQFFAKLKKERLVKGPAWRGNRTITTPSALNYLATHLRHIPFFAEAASAFVMALAGRLQARLYDEGDELIVENEPGEEMYIIFEGSVEITKSGSHLANKSSGYVGEIVLVSAETLRTASVTAETAVDAFVLSRNDLSSVLAQFPGAQAGIDAVVAKYQTSDQSQVLSAQARIQAFYQRMRSERADDALSSDFSELSNDIQLKVGHELRKNELFRDCEEPFLRSMCHRFSPYWFSASENIIRRGDKGSFMYFLLSGKIDVLGENDRVVDVVSPGHLFGEAALVLDEDVHNCTFKSAVECNLLGMSKEDLDELFVLYPKEKVAILSLAQTHMSTAVINELIGGGVTSEKDFKLQIESCIGQAIGDKNKKIYELSQTVNQLRAEIEKLQTDDRPTLRPSKSTLLLSPQKRKLSSSSSETMHGEGGMRSITMSQMNLPNGHGHGFSTKANDSTNGGGGEDESSGPRSIAAMQQMRHGGASTADLGAAARIRALSLLPSSVDDTAGKIALRLNSPWHKVRARAVLAAAGKSIPPVNWADVAELENSVSRLRQSVDVVTLINLIIHLKSDPSDAWVETFMDHDGYAAFEGLAARVEASVVKAARASLSDMAVQLLLLLARRVLLNVPQVLDLIIEDEGPLHTLVSAALASCNSVMQVDAFSVLAAVTVYSGKSVDRVLSVLQAKSRLGDIVDLLDGVEAVPVQTAVMCFFNAFVAKTDLDARMWLRDELADNGFHHVLHSMMCSVEDNSGAAYTALEVQLRVWVEQEQTDAEELDAVHEILGVDDLSDPTAVTAAILARTADSDYQDSFVSVLQHLLLIAGDDKLGARAWPFVESCVHRAVVLDASNEKESYRLTLKEVASVVNLNAGSAPSLPSPRKARGGSTSSNSAYGKDADSGPNDSHGSGGGGGGGGGKGPRPPPPPAPPVPPPPPLSTGGAGGGPGSGSASSTPTRKPLFWEPVSKLCAEASFWNEVSPLSKRGEDSPHASKLDKLFTLTPSKRGQGSKSAPAVPRLASSLGSRNAKVTLLERSRASNIGIVLSQFKDVAFTDIKDALITGRTSLTTDQLAALVKFAPTDTELELVESYEGDTQSLGEAEQLFLVLSPVPRIPAKFEVLFLRSEFDSLSAVVEHQTSLLLECCESLEASTLHGKFGKVLALILEVGCVLNAGTTRGKITAFRLSTLAKLRDTRSTTKSHVTLLHYIVQTADDDGFGDWTEEIANLDEATTVVVSDVKAVLSGLQARVKAAAREVERSAEEDGEFHEEASTFVARAEAELSQLSRQMGKCHDVLQRLALMFSESSGSDVLAMVASFARDIEESREEVRVWHEEKARKKRIRERRKAKRARGGNNKNVMESLLNNMAAGDFAGDDGGEGEDS